MTLSQILFVGATGGAGTTTAAVATAKVLGGTVDGWTDRLRLQVMEKVCEPSNTLTNGYSFDETDRMPLVTDMGRLDDHRDGDNYPSASFDLPHGYPAVLVLRGPSYSGLKRAAAWRDRWETNWSAVLVVREPGRTLTDQDVAQALSVARDRIVVTDQDPAVARADDAGLIARRLPRAYESDIKRVARLAQPEVMADA